MIRHLGVAAVLGLLIVLMMPAVASAQPAIPHSIEDRADCLMCHETGVAGAPQIPESPNHTSYTSSMCTICHRVAGAEANQPTATTPPTLATRTPAAQATATPTQPAAAVPSTGDEMPLGALALIGLAIVTLGWGMRRHFSAG
jgi:hypothetical protein